MASVLAVGAHPDDEAIGCGGTLRRHAEKGDTVRAVFLTSGEAGGQGIEAPGDVREREARTAAGILGIDDVEFWREPDGSLRAGGAVVDRLRLKLEELEPDSVYVSHSHEMHPDHRAATRAVARAVTRLDRSRPRPLVKLFEIWTPLRRIDEVVDISPYIDAKLSAIRAYESQCALMSFDEAFRGLGRYRGEMHSWPGGDYAEIFAHLRLP
jgi:N-acetylglucosamine malate deacetylase 1